MYGRLSTNLKPTKDEIRALLAHKDTIFDINGKVSLRKTVEVSRLEGETRVFNGIYQDFVHIDEYLKTFHEIFSFEL